MTSISGWPTKSTDDDHIEKVLAVICQNRRLTVCEFAEVGIYKSSCHLIFTKKLKIHCIPAKFVKHLLTRHSFTKHETTVVPSHPNVQIGPCGHFFLPKVEMLTERLPISDGTGERIKFNTGPSHRPTRHVPRRVQEM